MPRPIGSPITVTNGQPQREVERFQVFVSYDASGTPIFRLQAHTVKRLRDGAGLLIYQQPGLDVLITYEDATLPAPQRAQLIGLLNKFDTLADPAPL